MNQRKTKDRPFKSLRRVLRYLRPYKWLAIGATLSLLLVTVANLVTPQLLRYVIDGGIAMGNPSAIVWGTVGLAVVALMRGLFNFTQTFWGEQASQGVAFDVRNQIFSKIQGLSFSYHDQAQTGQLMTRATNDVELVRQFTGQALFQILNSLAMLVGSIIVLLSMNWRLGLVMLLVIPAIGAVLLRFARNIRPMFGEIQAELGKLNSVLQENLAGIRVVKAFARSGFERERFEQYNTSYKEKNLDFIVAASASFPAIFFFSNMPSPSYLPPSSSHPASPSHTLRLF